MELEYIDLRLKVELESQAALGHRWADTNIWAHHTPARLLQTMIIGIVAAYVGTRSESLTNFIRDGIEALVGSQHRAPHFGGQFVGYRLARLSVWRRGENKTLPGQLGAGQRLLIDHAHISIGVTPVSTWAERGVDIEDKHA